ncbi:MULTISPECIES: DUF2207 domain-containing protein [Kribbella]|uniref:DUF2207 domain-containing protein n=1 Tax=Kribbella TaxID=182639 RepID=UPI0031CEFF63
MRRGFFTAVAAVFAGLVLAGSAVPSQAATTGSTDVIDSMQFTYEVTADGVLKVREQIVYRFLPAADRHGIIRDLITREVYVDDKSKDQEYRISNVRVSSPSGDSADFTQTVNKTNNDRDQSLRIKIGAADRTVKGPTATYVLQYDVRGALRHFADHSELYWDTTGTLTDAVTRNVSVKVTVPEGVQRATCFAGPQGSSTPCDQATVTAGTGVYSQAELAPHSGLTVVAAIPAGVVKNDTPIVVDAPGFLQRNGLTVPGLIGSGAVSFAAILAAVLYSKNGNKDQRFAGMPPGSFPPDGMVAAPVKDDLKESQLPVAFSPPRIPVAEGGLLIDAKANTTETAATLIDLAVRGGIRIDNTGEQQKAVLVNPAVATAPHEQYLMQGLFPGLQPGAEIVLERRPTGDTSMREAHDAMIAQLREQIRQRNWYVRMPRAGGGKAVSGGARVACLGILGTWIFGGLIGGTAIGAATGGLGRAILFGVPALAVVIAIAIWFGVRGRGQRTAAGRAVTDQLVGFRTYLATAEADQLKFEEGEDIFSKYLPWAIAFELADRWQRVCAQLVAAGRITPDPYWYTGPSYYSSGFAAGSISQTVANTFDPPPAPAGSGGGGGSSSGFSGGFSGGGGGGGGTSSW